MPEKGTERAEDSSATADSSNGEHSAFSAEERALPDDLLKSSSKFISLYEEHQPELQQIINQMLIWTDEFLEVFINAAKLCRGRRIAAAVGAGLGVGVGVGAIGAFLAAISGALDWYTSTPALETMVISAVGTGALTTVGVLTVFPGDKNKQKKLLMEAETTLEIFIMTADRVISPLNNICKHVEKMLQYHNDDAVRKSAGVLSELAELFTPLELLRLSAVGTSALEMAENIKQFISPQPFMTKDTKTLRDVSKLKLISTVQEEELESDAGRFVWKTRKQVMHLQDSLNEMRALKAELEKMLIPKLNKYFKQHRVTHERAETE
ncbi:uncharacterized protein LOC118803474 [Colossoma macropomum]|uniref:uncharacterized protein LOC118803474 n=1 Tax=Colossoma macropomum TaxID=42526 RepID=UPI00186468AB|nr:uncharacterized protein LOC118803474 [Colossoma macropomum]